MSYVSGARHNTGVDRATTSFDRPTSPSIGSGSVPSLPLWIPSIWQPSPSNPLSSDEPTVLPVPPKAEQGPSFSDPSSALAAALDSAVQSAVVRALGSSAPTANPPSPRMEGAYGTAEKSMEKECTGPLWAERERELTLQIESLQKRLDEKDRDVRSLSERLLGLERKIAVDSDMANHREERLAADVLAHALQAKESLAQSEKHLEGRLNGLQDQVKANQNALAKLRSSQRNSDAEAKSMRKLAQELSNEMSHLDMGVSAELEKSAAQVEQMRQCFTAQLSELRGTKETGTSCASEKESAELKRSLQANSDSVAALRSKLKRVESQMTDVANQSKDMMALNSGFEETTKHSLVKVTSVVDGFRTTVAQLQKNVSQASPDSEVLRSRLEGLESNLKSLKKLIESNLRTQWNAESIVKEQVSLITKHVCVAMRQYTARRISENNALIDQALRARVPEYAKNEEQFVLVRERDTDGGESVDIQRSSDVSSNASSS